MRSGESPGLGFSFASASRLRQGLRRLVSQFIIAPHMGAECAVEFRPQAVGYQREKRIVGWEKFGRGLGQLRAGDSEDHRGFYRRQPPNRQAVFLIRKALDTYIEEKSLWERRRAHRSHHRPGIGFHADWTSHPNSSIQESIPPDNEIRRRHVRDGQDPSMCLNRDSGKSIISAGNDFHFAVFTAAWVGQTRLE